MKTTKVLLIEDDKFLSFGLKEFLMDYNMKVDIVSSAEEALKMDKIDKFDVVLVDLRLPGINGEEFIKKCSKKYNGLKYIIYTGSSDYEIDEKLDKIATLSKNILKKPFNNFKVIK